MFYYIILVASPSQKSAALRLWLTLGLALSRLITDDSPRKVGYYERRLLRIVAYRCGNYIRNQINFENTN